MVPKSMVQFVGIPNSCAMPCISKYSEDFSLPIQIRSLIVSTRISAPPPGRESRPESLRIVSVSRTPNPDLDAICFTSTAVNDLMLNPGNLSLVSR